MWDVFISHASEDKEEIARPLAQRLSERGINVWFDEQTLRLGDSLRRKIDQGLANSRFGIVILSPNFFAKEWPQLELDSLVARELGSDKLILPVWHEIERIDITRYSPILAGKLAVSTSRGMDEVVRQILKVVEVDESGLKGLPRPQAKVTQLRFRDFLKADTITAKVAVQKFHAAEKSFTIKWPQQHEDLLAKVKHLLSEAEQYDESGSIFFGCEPEIVGNFIDFANSSIRGAEAVRNGAGRRIPLLLEGMEDYWGGGSSFLETALCNFLTLANFEVQYQLAYTLRFQHIYQEFFPESWESWFKTDLSRAQKMSRLFQINEPVYSAEVFYISDFYLGAYFWGPKSMVIEAWKSGGRRPITNSWFVKYLIPQVELALLRKSDAPALRYREEATVNKVRDENGSEVSGSQL